MQPGRRISFRINKVLSYLTVHGSPLRTAYRQQPAYPTRSCARPCLTEEGQRHHFQEIQWADGTRPFMMAHQMMDERERSSRQLLEEVVREGFILALPPSTAEWVMCHWPASLDAAIYLAEDHLAPQTRGKGGQAPSPHFRRSLVLWPPSASRAGLPGCTESPSSAQNAFPPHQPT